MSDLWICATCFGLRGESATHRRQLCSCASPKEHEALSEARYARDGTYWTRVAEICRCCGAEVLDAGHKFALWFCGACRGRARAVNEACGRCVIPIGWHSIVNGVYVNPKRLRSLSGATVEADQVNAVFRETGSVWEWGRRVVERQWHRAELPLGQDITVDDYLKAVRSRRVDKAALFEDLAAARGIPSALWPKSEAIKLDLFWNEDIQSACIFHSREEILWERPDGIEEYTDLLLRTERMPDRKWRWEASIGPHIAGKGDQPLASGIASSLDRAKADCARSVVQLILDQEQRFGPLLPPLPPIMPRDSEK